MPLKYNWIPIIVIGMFFIFPQSVRSQWPPVSFVNVGPYTNTEVGTNTHGSGFFDFNGDGWDDIFVVSNTSEGHYQNMPHFLLKNQGNGTFVNVTSQAKVTGYFTSAQGLAAADFDNDGDVEIVIGMGYGQATLFYINYLSRGLEEFADATSNMGTNIHNRGRNLSFVDYNNDGYLDLFVFGDPNSKSYHSLIVYKNRKGAGFVDASEEAGLAHLRSSDDLFGAAFGDFDNDGDIDFYEANYTTESNFFVNNGDSTFTEETVQRGLPKGTLFAGAFFLDYDNDGWFDLLIRRRTLTTKLFRNNQDGTFTDVSWDANIAEYIYDGPYGGGISAADFNNDGYIDVFLLSSSGIFHKLYNNNGDGTFTEIGAQAGLTSLTNYNWSAPVGDYNHDGYLDIYLCRSSSQPVSYYATLFHNNGGSNHWLHVKLVGVQSNKLGVGSRLVAYVNGLLQMRQILGGDSYKTDSFPAEFGLGTSEQVDSLIVYWPSGIVQREINIPCDTMFTLVEEEGTHYHRYFSVDGNVSYYGSLSDVPDVNIKMTGAKSDSSVTDTSGFYKMYDTIGEITLFPQKSDFDDVCDYTISAYDAALIARSTVGLESLTGYQLYAADVDSNGVIQMFDAAVIARYIVGLSNGANLLGTWEFDPDSICIALYGDYSDADFTAYIVGDVNGDWDKSEILSKKQIPPSLPLPLAMKTGDLIEVPITVEEYIPLLSSDIWLNYDSDILELVDIVKTDASESFNLFQNTDKNSGNAKTALFGVDPIHVKEPFLKLIFRVLKPENETRITWDRFQINDVRYQREDLILRNTHVENSDQHPKDFYLDENFPNPFNPETTIRFHLPGTALVSLEIFDALGRHVRTVLHQSLEAGTHDVQWDSKDDQGKPMASGVYFIQMKAGDFVQRRKMALVR